MKKYVVIRFYAFSSPSLIGAFDSYEDARTFAELSHKNDKCQYDIYIHETLTDDLSVSFCCRQILGNGLAIHLKSSIMTQVKVWRAGILKSRNNVNWSITEYSSIQEAMQAMVKSGYFTQFPDAIPCFRYEFRNIKDEQLLVLYV